MGGGGGGIRIHFLFLPHVARERVLSLNPAKFVLLEKKRLIGKSLLVLDELLDLDDDDDEGDDVGDEEGLKVSPRGGSKEGVSFTDEERATFRRELVRKMSYDFFNNELVEFGKPQKT